jgi:hypothetical protein
MVRWREIMREITRLEFNRKYIKTIIVQAESSHNSSQPQLKFGSFNYRVRLSRVKLAQVKLTQIKLARTRVKPELNHEPGLQFLSS